MTIKKEETIIKILRWICVLPVFFLSYYFLFLTFYFGISFGMSRIFINEILSDIDRLGGFGGHYFLGPMVLFLRDSLSIGLAIFVGAYVAPDYKKIVYIVLSTIMILLSIINAFYIGLYLNEHQRFLEFLSA
ncbi:MAG: hypothetical protein QXH95_04725, partial [Thermoplasmata archaeon]